MTEDPIESRVQEIRLYREMKAADVARNACMDPSTYNKIDKGKRGVSPQFVKQIAAALNVSISALRDEIGAPIPGQSPATPTAASSQFLIPEYDVAPQGGYGAIVEDVTRDGSRAVDHWSIPTKYLAAFTESPSELVIVRVAGDSMEPDYVAGERVLVDTSHKVPSPPGVYVVWDGLGLVLKRLEVVFGSKDPVMVRIMSINPGYSTYERTLDEVQINGRVVGKWVWK